MKQLLLIGAGLLALSACAPQVPDSGAGVGFSDYTQYELERAQREAQLRGQGGQTAAPEAPVVPPQSGGISSSELAAAGIDNSGDDALRTQGVQATPGNAAPTLASNPGISDEQDFEAVSGRESIESDAERLERQAAAYQVIEPTALPARPGSGGPNIVQYALNAPNDRGEPIYQRGGISGSARFQRNCAKYNTPDDAQRDFLSRGGPERDRLGIDPDGDGFACGWDPSAFRAIAAGN